MTDLLDRLKTALADRYRIEQALGAERFVQEITATARPPEWQPLDQSLV